MVNSISIGTFNIQKPDANWSVRRPQIIENIKQADLDVVCLQELSDAEKDRSFFSEEFRRNGYNLSAHTEKAGKTSLGIVWKESKFEFVKAFTKSFEALDGKRVCKRCVSVVDLRDTTTRKLIRVGCIHLYTEPREAGQTYLGISQLQTFRQQLENEPGDISRLIIAGDYNADFGRRRGSEVLNIMDKPQAGSDYLYRTVTHDDRGNKIQTKGRNKVDWVFAGTKNSIVPSLGAPVRVAPKVTYHPVNIAFPNASDHLMHAVNVHEENEVYVEKQSQIIPEPTHDLSVVQKLQSCFSNKTEIVRDDLIRSGLVTRANSNQKATEWVKAGLLVQSGRGRNTYYTRGPKLGNPSPDVDSLIQKLRDCFSNKTEIVRDDLIRSGLVTKANSNQKATEWVKAGLLVQSGRGRNTYYTRGPKLGNPSPDINNKRSEIITHILRLIGELLKLLNLIFGKNRKGLRQHI